jgi:hypothetical protein
MYLVVATAMEKQQQTSKATQNRGQFDSPQFPLHGKFPPQHT